MSNNTPCIGIVRIGTGNVLSVKNALQRLGVEVCDVNTPSQLDEVSGIILPGVGSAGFAMQQLEKSNLIESLRKLKKPYLGICLGMQLLFECSDESPVDCLGILRGQVGKLPKTLVRPHMGWNLLSNGEYAYFVHNFVCSPVDKSVVTHTVEYGQTWCASVAYKNFFGVQWHPEKSGTFGQEYLSSFVSLCK